MTPQATEKPASNHWRVMAARLREQNTKAIDTLPTLDGKAFDAELGRIRQRRDGARFLELLGEIANRRSA